MPVAKFTQSDYTSQTGTAYPLNIDSDVRVMSETVVDFAPRAADTPNMTVLVEAGTIRTASGDINVSQQTSATITAPITPNNRIDRIVMNRATGIINVVTGTPAVSPVAPAIPVDRIPICQFTVVPLQTSITNASITDERTFVVGVGTMAFQNADAVAIAGGTAVLSTLNTRAIGNASGNIPVSNGVVNVGLNADLLDGLTTGNASGNIPVSNGTLNVNLNADMVEGLHASTTPGANIIPVHDSNSNIQLGRVVGIGTAPDTDHTAASLAVQEFGDFGLIHIRSDGGFDVMRNAKNVSGAYVYRTTGTASIIQLHPNNGITFFTAPSGSAGSTIAWLARLFIPNTVGQPMAYEGNTVRHDKNIFHGRVTATGAASRLPAGWSSVKIGTGQYRITHSLGVTYSVVAYLSDNGGEISSSAISLNDFLVNTAYDGTGNIDRAFNFILMLD